jgi:hypothetical protein
LTGRSGSVLVEALAALAMTAVAASVVAVGAATSGAALLGARRDAAATVLALARAEALRAGPCGAGSDSTPADGVTYGGSWTCADGRGRPDDVGVTVAWPGHRLAVATEVLR